MSSIGFKGLGFRGLGFRGFGVTMVPNIEYDYILLLGIAFYIRNIILLGATTKKSTTHLVKSSDGH